MTLHVPTMFVALLLAFALFGVALAFARSLLRDQAELRLWGWSTWLLVAGFVALAARTVFAEWVAVLLGNGLVFASLFLMSHALHQFIVHRNAPPWQLGLLVGSLVCLGAIVSLPLPVRTSIVSMLVAAQLVPIVWLVVRRGWHGEPSLRTVAITFALTAAALVIRSAHALWRPDEYTGFFQASLGNGLTYFASFLFPLGAGFGFVLANLERLAGNLKELATHDALTGCTNRGLFQSVLQQALERARREFIPVSLIVLDIDNFKEVNDQHGHPAGDAVLRGVAAALQGRLRAADCFGRLGGEEFGVVMAGADASGAAKVAEDLRHTVEALEVPLAAGGRLRVTISLGVSTAAGTHLPTYEDLFAQADKALYEAKREGRNRVVSYVQDDGGGVSGARTTVTEQSDSATTCDDTLPR